MAEPTTKKPRRSLLPDLESMEAKRSVDKQAVTAVKSGYEDMKRVNLELTSVKRLEKLDDEVKLLWLMAKYSVVAVLKVLVALNTVPASLTENQARKYVLRMANADQTIEGDLEAIYTFLSKSCSSDALGRIASSVQTEGLVLGPPALECFGCCKPLVLYLTSSVKLYTCSGMKLMEKVILQCKDCHLIYNPTQYGNKHAQGYPFYHEEQPIVEVSDTVYFERSLLEWQCCLA